MKSPVIRSSAACPSPTNFGRSQDAPMSAPESPTRTNRNAIFAVSDATRRSQAEAITAPAPATVPFSAAITGFRQRRMFRIRSQVMSVKRRSPAASRAKSAPMMSSTSPPEQKALPAPADGRIMLPQPLAPGFPDGLPAGAIRGEIRDVYGDARQIGRSASRGAQHRDHLVQSARELAREIGGLALGALFPSRLPGDEEEPSLLGSQQAVFPTLRRSQCLRIDDLELHRARAPELTRRASPVRPLSSRHNSTTRAATSSAVGRRSCPEVPRTSASASARGTPARA